MSGLGIGLLLLLVPLVAAAYFFAVKPAAALSKAPSSKGELRRLKAKVNDVFDVLDAVMKFHDSVETKQSIHAYYVSVIRQLGEFNPNESVEELLAEAEKTGNLIKQNVQFKDVFESQQELTDAKRMFSKAAKIIQVLHKRKQISPTSAKQQFIGVRHRILRMEAETLVQFGKDAEERNDPMTATSYYKKARNILVENNMQFEGKAERIREIATMIKSVFGGAVEEAMDGKKDDKEEKGEGKKGEKRDDKPTDTFKDDNRDPSKLEKQFEEEEQEFDENGFPLDPTAPHKRKI